MPPPKEPNPPPPAPAPALTLIITVIFTLAIFCLLYLIGYFVAAILTVIMSPIIRAVLGALGIVFFILQAFFLPVFVIDSIRAALMLAGVPRNSLSIRTLEMIIEIFSWGFSASHQAITLQPIRIPEKWGNSGNSVFGLVTTIVSPSFVYMIYTGTSNWPHLCRWPVVGFAAFNLLSCLIRIWGGSLNPRSVWLVAITSYLTLTCVIAGGYNWLERLIIRGLATLLSLIFLESIGVSNMAEPQKQTPSGRLQFNLLPPDPRVHLWLVVTANWLAGVLGVTANWPWVVRLVFMVCAIVVALICLRMMENKANASRLATVPMPVPIQEWIPPAEIPDHSEFVIIEPGRHIRTPPQLRHIGMFSDEREHDILMYYRYYLEGRLYNRVMSDSQAEAVGFRIFESLSESDMARSMQDEDFLEFLIDEAIDYEMLNNPNFLLPTWRHCVSRKIY
ncbi:hypothetical protein SAMD00023353_7800470 [Rosellinia necatrix]|uniref:Uncharacterized protein n=1 Tax=Rosellinia necatrix TaxID=77044 RepID=A0A1S8AAX4_ROSNE|nr:hypothetical protein SAMD00023353_7800470 [Rosellinia necatrix]